MAEIAIPLIALGSMYIMSNQDNNTKKYKEGLTNMTQIQNELPGVNPPMMSKNYPVDSSSSINQLNVNKYSNPNQTTDKIFNQANYSNIEQNNSI